MSQKYKIDLHTHSVRSKDGGITHQQYFTFLEKGLLDCIAITDHNTTEFAQKMKVEFGEKIIIGEEITTLDGEIIGLFLEKKIPPDLSALQTVKLIRGQDAIVYIPHPFEKLRHGLKENVLKEILDYIDIIEVFNARARWRGESRNSLKFAQDYNLSQASSSDSHCRLGLASSYSLVDALPHAKNIESLLKKGSLERRYAPLLSYLCPAVNKIKNNLKF